MNTMTNTTTSAYRIIGGPADASPDSEIGQALAARRRQDEHVSGLQAKAADLFEQLRSLERIIESASPSSDFALLAAAMAGKPVVQAALERAEAVSKQAADYRRGSDETLTRLMSEALTLHDEVANDRYVLGTRSTGTRSSLGRLHPADRDAKIARLVALVGRP